MIDNIFGFICGVFFVRFMRSFIGAISQYCGVDSRISASIDNYYGSITYSYPVEDLTAYPSRYLTYLIIHRVLTFIAVPLLVYGN